MVLMLRWRHMNFEMSLTSEANGHQINDATLGPFEIEVAVGDEIRDVRPVGF